MAAVKSASDVRRGQRDDICPNLTRPVGFGLEEAALLPPLIPGGLNGRGVVCREVRVAERLDDLLLAGGCRVLVAGESRRGGRLYFRGCLCGGHLLLLLLHCLLLCRELRCLVGLGLVLLVWSAPRGVSTVNGLGVAGFEAHHSSWGQAHPAQLRECLCRPFLQQWFERCSVEAMGRQAARKL